MLKPKEQTTTTRTSPINSSKLRQLWTVVEETQTNILLGFGDRELVQQLIGQLENRGLMTCEEVSSISAYLSSRVPLIRDLAYARRFAV